MVLELGVTSVRTPLASKHRLLTFIHGHQPFAPFFFILPGAVKATKLEVENSSTYVWVLESRCKVIG